MVHLNRLFLITGLLFLIGCASNPNVGMNAMTYSNGTITIGGDLLKNTTNLTEQEFIYLHELGHFKFHKDKILTSNPRKIEFEADKFAMNIISSRGDDPCKVVRFMKRISVKRKQTGEIFKERYRYWKKRFDCPNF